MDGAQISSKPLVHTPKTLSIWKKKNKVNDYIVLSRIYLAQVRLTQK